MEIYIALGLIIAVLIAAGICVYAAYRKGLRDGLDIGRTNRMRDPVVKRAEEKQAVEKVEGDSLVTQISTMFKF